MDIREFLKKAVAGTGFFDPASSSEQDLKEFQHLVELAQEAKTLGYIEDYRVHRESETGHDFYDTLLIINVTADGIRRAGEP